MDASLVVWLTVVPGTIAVAGATVFGLWMAIRPEKDGQWTRPAAAGLIIGWLAIAVLLGGLGVFEAEADQRLPLIAFAIVVPLAVGIWLVTREGKVCEVVDRIPLSGLIGIQLYRVLGTVFLVAWAQGDLPAEFALPAGLGDIAVGLAAPLVARRVATRPESSRRMAVLWNLAGIADLVVAVGTGFLTSPSQFQQLSRSDPNQLITTLPLVLVPTFAVPLSIVLHAAALRRLGRAGDQANA